MTDFMIIRCFKEVASSDFLHFFPEISSVNVLSTTYHIPCLIVSIKKNRKHHVNELHRSICEIIPGIEGIKMILYVEYNVDPNNLAVALWRFCNNLDPKRDHILFERESKTEPGKIFACLGLDGTRKTKEFDGFQRDWF